MARDLHRKPFDEGTKAKLSIFQNYLRDWLPVWFSQTWWKSINIYDFFAGPGTDLTGYKGTPLIILEELKPYLDRIKVNRLHVNLYLNEYDKDKCLELQSIIEREFADELPINIEFDSKDFQDAFVLNLPKMKANKSVNLLFLDQNGISHIDKDTFSQIVELKSTDFLFFISSSILKRFADHPNILTYHNIDRQVLENTPYHQIHRLVLEYYRGIIPPELQYYLSSFSLKKHSGVYGLIFGSGNVLGFEKFLRTCWKIDPERGEANFDIDDDRIIKGQPDLFTGEVPRPKKVDLFENDLRDSILAKKLKNNRDVYLFTVLSGFLPAHAREVIKQLHNEDKIKNSRLLLSNDTCKPSAQLTEIILA